MLELTKKADYALRLMIEVAAAGEGSLSTAEVAHREDIPHQFLRKVAQDLVASGLLTSSRGARGGLSLAHPAETISLLEIVRAVDQPMVSKCVVDPGACTRRHRCVVYPVWRRIQQEMERAMEQVLLSDLAERHRVTVPSTGGPQLPVRMALKETPNIPINTGKSARPPGRGLA
jgi:Rrf2 family protein